MSDSTKSVPVVTSGFRPWFRLLAAIARKQFTLLVRYPINTISQLFGLYVFFALIFFGGQAVGGAAFGESLAAIIVGFFLFTMTIVAYSGLAWDVTREAQWGTLEQLFMSPFGFGRVMAAKAAVNVCFSLLWGGVILLSMLVTTGQSLSVNLVTVLPVGVLTIASALGVGFVFAGLALVYKRIENLFQLIQFAFVALIAAPVDAVPALRLLPLAQGSALLREAMTQGTQLWEFQAFEVGMLVLTAVGYLAIGAYVFGRASRRARRLGVLGQY
ncbi:ABC transporter [Haloprofundus marisrubri]|uniref:ABC transporter n=1 Tax=Haloprofundus marisrubri TaxID=1514971 RepID=A0A0W1R9D6_9EURY|nr:ABC transporter permease [Haloprofundus marisrubri]KTG10045.1 ABC transporter [Haloprofundus marisrubri]